MSDMTWVTKANGVGWSSNRTRDLVDLAFTINREHGDYYAEVLVRCTYYNAPDARARRTIGRFYFKNHKLAKANIEAMLNIVKSNPALTDQKSAREAFLMIMLDITLDEGAPGKKSFLYPYGIINSKYQHVASTTTPAVVTTAESVIEEDPVMEEFLAPTMSAEEMLQAVETELEQRLATMPSMMLETVMEVAETVNKAMETPKIIVINGKEIPISWPS